MASSPNPIQKLEYIVKFFIDPCDAPLTVWARTAGPAFLEAFITLYAINFGEIFDQSIRSAIAPNRRRSQKKGAKGKKSKRNKWLAAAGGVASADPNEMIGKQLGKYFKLPKGVSGLGATLWVVTGVIERLVFYVFLAELILETFYKWVSLMEKTVYCQAARDTVLLVHEPAESLIAISGTKTLALFEVQKIRGPISWFVAAGSSSAAPLTIAFGANWTYNGAGISPEGDAWLEIVALINGVEHVIDRVDATLKHGQTQAVMLHGEIPAASTFFVRGRVETFFVQMTLLNLYCFNEPPPEE